MRDHLSWEVVAVTGIGLAFVGQSGPVEPHLVSVQVYVTRPLAGMIR